MEKLLIEEFIIIKNFGAIITTIKISENDGDTCELCKYNKEIDGIHDSKICDYCLDNLNDDEYLN